MLANSQHNKRLSRLKSHSRDEVRTVVPANYTELSGVLRAKIIMAVKLVMGAQRDSLEKLEKFGGEDGGVIFPTDCTTRKRRIADIKQRSQRRRRN